MRPWQRLTGLLGLSLERKKEAAHVPLLPLDPPDLLYFPTQQHQGNPAIPVVKRGDRVKVGTLLAKADGSYSVPVHSSVSGRVKAIDSMLHPWGMWTTTIVIEQDHAYTLEDLPPGYPDPTAVSPEEIIERVRQSGIVGMGGAMYPTALKLSSKQPIDTIIINGCECEPVLTCDHRTMLERTDALLYGIRALRHIFSGAHVIVAIERNKPDAIRLYRELGRAHRLFEVADLPSRYPYGAERVLIPAVTGRSIPYGKYPDSIGVVVQNVATVAAIADALRDGMPLIQRPITVAGGAVSSPANLVVRIGTPVSYILDQVGLTTQPREIVLGGPMMGITVSTADIPVLKGTSGILARTAQEIHHYSQDACLRCGRCVDVCPANLMPTQLAKLSAHGQYEEADKLGVRDCMECGLCSYQCPADLPLTQLIRLAKHEVRRKKEVTSNGRVNQTANSSGA